MIEALLRDGISAEADAALDDALFGEGDDARDEGEWIQQVALMDGEIG